MLSRYGSVGFKDSMFGLVVKLFGDLFSSKVLNRASIHNGRQ